MRVSKLVYRFLITFSILTILLLLFSIAILDRGSESYVISVVTLALITPFLLVVLLLTYFEVDVFSFLE